jgi:hypothetical protein
MSFWGRKGRVTPTIRIEKVAAPGPPASVKKTPQVWSQAQPVVDHKKSRSGGGSSGGFTALTSRKKTVSRKRSPALQRVESDSEDDGSLIPFDNISSKKVKTISNVTLDARRQLGAFQTFTVEDENVLIHAAEIACVRHKFTLAFGTSPDDVCVDLQYPGSAKRERYVVRFSSKPMLTEVLDTSWFIAKLTSTRFAKSPKLSGTSRIFF